MDFLIKVFATMALARVIQSFHAPTNSRHRRQNFHHPAFSMVSMYPGLGMGSAFGSTECIRDDIVCPTYCLMEDEWGCKSCPCGPANGMSPAIKDHRQSHPNKEEHECMGTILCMLTCKDGYRLGPRGNNGCQSCECNKKNRTKSERGQEKPTDCSGPACSKKTESRTTTPETSVANHKDGSECEWPLCMKDNSNSHGKATSEGITIGPNSGPGPKSGLSPLPIGGSNSAAGGSVPGIDCIGPECSAKHGQNGLRTMDGLSAAPQPGKPASQKATPAPKACSITEEVCSRHCDGMAKLRAPGRDGCPVCECVIVSVPTTPAPNRVCGQVDECMQSCKYGFRLDQPRRKQECPTCECVSPRTTPPTTTSQRPNIVGLLHVCPDAVHCMKACTSGYTLTSSPYEQCPVCTCNTAPRVILLCEEPLSCPNGCTVGYKCDTHGCPTCTCVTPTETVLRVEVHTTIMQSALRCRPKFSCVDRCGFGYRTGNNGCPTCFCLEPVTIKTNTTQLIPTPPPVHQNVIVMPRTQAPPIKGVPSGIGCIGPACSAIHTVGGVMLQPQARPLIDVTSGAGCIGPACSAIHTVSGAFHIPNRIVNGGSLTESVIGVPQHQGVQTSKPGTRIQPEPVTRCLGMRLCMATCVDGYRLGAMGSQGCLSCECVRSTQYQTKTGTTPRTMTAMEACPETVQCVARCEGRFDLIPIDGSSCPVCKCKGVEWTPSPGQCVGILHCVMTCTRGYDIGDYQSDGCPTCTCLDEK